MAVGWNERCYDSRSGLSFASPGEVFKAFRKLGDCQFLNRWGRNNNDELTHIFTLLAFSTANLSAFVAEHFLPAGNDTLAWTPPDYTPTLPFAAVGSCGEGANSSADY